MGIFLATYSFLLFLLPYFCFTRPDAYTAIGIVLYCVMLTKQIIKMRHLHNSSTVGLQLSHSFYYFLTVLFDGQLGAVLTVFYHMHLTFWKIFKTELKKTDDSCGPSQPVTCLPVISRTGSHSPGMQAIRVHAAMPVSPQLHQLHSIFQREPGTHIAFSGKPWKGFRSAVGTNMSHLATVP